MKTGNPVLALATKLFKLVKRNPKLDGVGGITTAPKPQTSGRPNKRPAVIVTPKPRRPLIKVAPVRKVSCIGGKIARNNCFCPARTKKIKVGAKAYRCISSLVKPNQVGPKAPPRRAAQARKKVMIGKLRKSSARRR